ncbi:class I SAM-dependent methyltransferase, partial [bacterium]|nr:class I SAM-dependent methyltransferase [bacterium]
TSVASPSAAPERLVAPDAALLADVLEWDVVTWSRAVRCWCAAGLPGPGRTVVDLGSRRGGLSLLFARDGAHVVCSDLDGPSPEARALHERHGVADRVDYRALDATALDLPDRSVDAVCFKSVLGGVGRDDNFVAQRKALAEIRRVLVPGGRLYFAENLTASPLHGFLRRCFIPWGGAWRYVSLAEMAVLLADFEVRTLAATGFWATFGRSNAQRDALARLDRLVAPVVPRAWRYVAYGVADVPNAG